jgi:hypothetical protein
MLDALFPYGFILVPILAFLLFAVGIICCMFLALQRKLTFMPSVILALLVGLVLSYLYYHVIFAMICKQYSC